MHQNDSRCPSASTSMPRNFAYSVTSSALGESDTPGPPAERPANAAMSRHESERSGDELQRLMEVSRLCIEVMHCGCALWLCVYRAARRACQGSAGSPRPDCKNATREGGIAVVACVLRHLSARTALFIPQY